MNVSFHAWVLPVVALAMMVIAASMWRQRTAPGARYFAGIIVLVIVWLVGDWLGHIGTSFAWRLAGEQIKYFGVTIIPVLLLVSTLIYRGQTIARRTVILLFVIPALSLTLIWTYPLHSLFWTAIEPHISGALKVQYGLYFWLVHTPYSYVMAMASAILMTQELLHSPRFYRTQMVVLVITTFIPLLSNFAYLSGLTGGVSYTSLSFAFFAMVMAWGLYRHHLFTSNPIAYEIVFQTIRDSVFVLDSNGLIADVNPAAAQILDRTPAQVIGHSAREVFAAWPDIFARFENVQEAQEEITTSRGGELRYVELRITPLFRRGALIGRIITARDITAAKTQQLMLETLAFRDPLTQLANRRSFELEAERILLEAQTTGGSFALLYFDLNKFKAVNDTWGHDAGDQLLKHVAARANSCLRRPDLLARCGGDEFVALVQNVDQMGATIVADRILASVKQPFKIKDHMLDIRLSLGIAFFPAHGATLNQVIQCADHAMYLSKAKGGGYTFYEPLAQSNAA